MPVSQREESLKLSKFLDNFYKTNYALRRVDGNILTFQSSWYVLLGEFFENDFFMLPSGSLTEGSGILVPDTDAGIDVLKLLSDQDYLIVPKNVYVIPGCTANNEHTSFTKLTFEMSECCNPLFVLLKLVSCPYSESPMDKMILQSLESNEFL